MIVLIACGLGIVIGLCAVVGTTTLLLQRMRTASLPMESAQLLAALHPLTESDICWSCDARPGVDDLGLCTSCRHRLVPNGNGN